MSQGRFEKMMLIPVAMMDHFHQKQVEKATFDNEPIKMKSMQLYEKLKNILSDTQMSDEQRAIEYANTLQNYLTTLRQHDSKVQPGSLPTSVPISSPLASWKTPSSVKGERDLVFTPPQFSPIAVSSTHHSSKNTADDGDNDDDTGKTHTPLKAKGDGRGIKVTKSKKKKKAKETSLFDTYLRQHYTPKRTSTPTGPRTRARARQEWLKDWVRW